MDQGPLVNDQIDAGLRLMREFDNYAQVHAAFWLKDAEDGEWFFYLASDRIDDFNVTLAIAEVIRILRKGPKLWLDPILVKVIGADNPLARDVIDIQQKYARLDPLRLRTCRIGGLTVEEIYIYPVPVAAPA